MRASLRAHETDGGPRRGGAVRRRGCPSGGEGKAGLGGGRLLEARAALVTAGPLLKDEKDATVRRCAALLEAELLRAEGRPDTALARLDAEPPSLDPGEAGARALEEAQDHHALGHREAAQQAFDAAERAFTEAGPGFSSQVKDVQALRGSLAQRR